MRRFFISVSVIITALVSCQKNANEPTVSDLTQNPIKITLKASIANDTKVTYVDEDNVLKTAWEQYDKVSLLAVDISGNLLSNDIFTATSSGKTVEFDGEFTNDPATKAVYVYYPALAQGDGSSGNPFAVHSPDSYNSHGVLYGVKKGECYLSFYDSYQLQKSNGGTSHLAQYAVMSGQADLGALEENNMNVALEHRSYVIKATFTLPESGLTVYSARMDFDLQAPSVGVGGFGWTYINEKDSFPGNSQKTDITMVFGEDVVSGNGTGVTLEGNELIVYFPAYAAEFWSPEADSYLWNKINPGDKVSFTVSAEEGTYILNDVQFNKEILLENGKMYRLSATLESELI